MTEQGRLRQEPAWRTGAVLLSEEMHTRMMERAKKKGVTVPDSPGPRGPKGPGPR